MQEDSVQLWKSIIQNPLLKNANLVLFLNKCDVLKAKLQSGTRMADYVMSYGNRPNDFESASKCLSHFFWLSRRCRWIFCTTDLKKKFSGIHRDFSVEARPLYCHFTQVIDTKSTKLILNSGKSLLLVDMRKRSDGKCAMSSARHASSRKPQKEFAYHLIWTICHCDSLAVDAQTTFYIGRTYISCNV